MSEPFRSKIEHNGVTVEILFDGFCFTVSSEDKYLFAASINDPTVSERGNACLLLFDADEIASRMEAHEQTYRRTELCLVTDGNLGVCNMSKGHDGVIHREITEEGTLWSEWRSIVPEDELRRAAEYIPPAQRECPIEEE